MLLDGLYSEATDHVYGVAAKASSHFRATHHLLIAAAVRESKFNENDRRIDFCIFICRIIDIIGENRLLS